MDLRQQIAAAIAGGQLTESDVHEAIEQASEINRVKRTILELAESAGLSVEFTADRLAPNDTKRDGRRSAPIKYRDHAGNTWSGRGMKPKWLQQHIQAGRSPEEFAVQ